MARDQYTEVRRALARQRAEGDNLKLDRYTRGSAADLSLDDLARVLADVIAAERADLIGHMHRLFQLSKAGAHHDDTRFKNLHQRLCQIESELRQIVKRK